MTYLIVNWFLSALSLVIVAHLIPGIRVSGFGTALIAAIAIGLVNATIGFVLKVLTFPLTLITFGLFLLILNAILLKMAAWLVPGFAIRGFLPALLGSIVLSVVHAVLRYVVFSL